MLSFIDVGPGIVSSSAASFYSLLILAQIDAERIELLALRRYVSSSDIQTHHMKVSVLLFSLPRNKQLN